MAIFDLGNADLKSETLRFLVGHHLYMLGQALGEDILRIRVGLALACLSGAEVRWPLIIQGSLLF